MSNPPPTVPARVVPEPVLRAVTQIADTLLAYTPRLRIVLFGSRATGAADPRSDVDIGIDAGEALPLEVLDRIRETLEDLAVLQKVDVVDLAAADPEFRRIALASIVPLYEREAEAAGRHA